MANTASIYGKIAASRLRAHLQYRLSFGVQVLGAYAFSFLDFVMILVIFHRIPHMKGWSIGEVAFLYGSSYMTFRIADMLMTNLDRIPMLIRMGTFDQALTRPLGTLGQVLTGDVDIRHIGGFIQGAMVFVYAMSRVQIEWTTGRMVVFALMLVSAVAIFCAIWVTTNAISFWTMDAREVANSFTYGGNMLTQFPLHIFGVWVRRLLGFAIPLAFVNYYPGLYILDKPDPTNAPGFLRFISPLVALASLGVARLVWRAAVRHYRSTGS